MTAPVAADTVKLVAFIEPDVLKSTPPVPAVRLTVVAANAPVALIPPAASEAFNVSDDAELPASEITPANVSLTFTVPVASVMVNVLALLVPEVFRSIPAAPAVRLTVPEAKLPVALIPPPTAEAFKVNAEPELAASEIRPALVSLTLATPMVLTVRVPELTEPVVAKFMPPLPALNVVVAALIVPLPVRPLAPFDAVKLKEVPELFATEILPAATSVMTTVPPVALACKVVALVELTAMPPAPAVVINEPVFRPTATSVEVTLPLAADSVIDPDTLYPPTNVISPLLEVKVTFGAVTPTVPESEIVV